MSPVLQSLLIITTNCLPEFISDCNQSPFALTLHGM